MEAASPSSRSSSWTSAREAQKKVREPTESVDNFAKAKEILEAKGMKVNQADVASFRKLAEEKIWPPYKQQYAEHVGQDRQYSLSEERAGGRSNGRECRIHRCRQHGQPHGGQRLEGGSR